MKNRSLSRKRSASVETLAPPRMTPAAALLVASVLSMPFVMFTLFELLRFLLG